MFSVIIPLYNKEKFINETLNSIVNQTFTKFELLIIDDGSTDGSITIVKQFEHDARIRLIHQKNAGVSAARNNGIRHAQFDIIAFIDADDLWHPQYLEQMALLWEQYPDIGAITSGIVRIKAFDKPDYNYFNGKLPYTFIDNYFKDKDKKFTSSSVTIKKNVFDSILPFDERLTHGEDLDLWNRIMLYHRAIFITETLCYYSCLPISSSEKYDNLPDINKHLVGLILDKYAQWLKPSSIVPIGFKYFIYKYTIHTLAAFYFTGYRKESEHILSKIPILYKVSITRSFLYIIPYKFGKNLYGKLVKLIG